MTQPTQPLSFQSRDGKPASGALALPAGEGKHPALVVVPEWFGLNDDMRDITGRFAADGILALAVDVFDGQVTADTKVAAQMVAALKLPVAVEIVAGAMRTLIAHPRCDGRVFVTGFCIGGAVALAASCGVPELAGAIPFYGVPREADWSRRRCPVIGHYGRRDDGIPVAKVEAMAEAMRAASSAPVTLHFYDAGHAFMRRPDPGKYDAPSATEAWARTLAFVRNTK